MYTAYALLKYINSPDGALRFRNFRITQIASPGQRADAQRLFPRTPLYGTEWLYERTYEDPEVGQGAYGFGRIPGDVEDTLLLLRLFRPGDIIITRHAVRDPGGRLSTQYPLRTTTESSTTSFFAFKQDECDQWDRFASDLKVSPSWGSSWFGIARKFFLYGGAKEFNPGWGEVDRIVDYMVALEATLVPERGFGIGRRLRQRAISMLALQGEESTDTNRLLRDFYDIRSTLVHGSPLGDKDGKTFLRMPRLELVIRQILLAALRRLPPDEESRRQYLSALYDVADADLAVEIAHLFNSLSSIEEKQRLLASLR